MTDEDEYPSLRKAALGNGHTGNLYCLCKWILWQTFHVVFTIIGIFLMISIVAFFIVYRGVVFVARSFYKGLVKVGSLIPPIERSLPEPPEPTPLYKVGETMKEKPVTRRIFNECPVDIKQDTRWFSRLSSIVVSILEAIEPEDTVWVCNECGHKQPTEPTIKKHSKNNCSGTYEEVQWHV